MSMVSCIPVDFNITNKMGMAAHMVTGSFSNKRAWLTKEAELHQNLTMTRLCTSVYIPSN